MTRSSVQSCLISVTASLRRANRSLPSGQARPERHLVERLAGADAEDDPARGQAAERGEGLRDHGRVVAERRREHAGADQHPLGAGAERAQPRQRGRGVPAVVATPRLEVVGDEDGESKPVLLRPATAEVGELGWPELLRGRLVAQVASRHGGSCRLHDAGWPAYGPMPADRHDRSTCSTARRMASGGIDSRRWHAVDRPSAARRPSQTIPATCSASIRNPS